MFAATWGASVETDVALFYPDRSPEEVAAYYVARFREHAGFIDVNPDAPIVFAWLRARGVRTAVITNTPGTLAREVVAGAGLAADVVLGDGDVPRAKPAPDMVFVALERLGPVEPEEAAVVGDSRFDREAAEAAGVRFWGLGIEGGDHTLDRLGDVMALVDSCSTSSS